MHAEVAGLRKVLPQQAVTFSFVGRCQGLAGSQKYTSSPVCMASCSWWTVRCPGPSSRRCPSVLFVDPVQRRPAQQQSLILKTDDGEVDLLAAQATLLLILVKRRLKFANRRQAAAA